MRHALGFLLVSLPFLAGSAAATAPRTLADVNVIGNEESGTRDCQKGVATINGNENTLTLKNCSKVVVNGNENKLTLEGCGVLEVVGNDNAIQAGAVTSIRAIGNDNKVTYKVGPKGKKPAVSNIGSGNTIKAG